MFWHVSVHQSVCPHLGGYPGQVQWGGGGTPARSSWGYPYQGVPLPGGTSPQVPPPHWTLLGGTPAGGNPTSGSLWFKKKSLVAQLDHQTTNPGSQGHISGSLRNSLNHVLEIDWDLVLLKTLQQQNYAGKEIFMAGRAQIGWKFLVAKLGYQL